MTYQVTLCGRDGVVVASDRCEVWTEQGGRKSKTGNKVRKVFLDSTRQLAWTFSGGHLSGLTAHYLEKAIKKLSVKNENAIRKAIQDCAERACSTFPLQKSFTDVLVLSIASERKILRACIAPEVAFDLMSDRFVSGQIDSLASFFPEHFYSKQMSVNELASLAAYSVRMAHELDPKYVDGLDIAIYRDEEKSFAFVDRNYYWEHAIDLDKAIRECLQSMAVRIPPSKSSD